MNNDTDIKPEIYSKFGLVDARDLVSRPLEATTSNRLFLSPSGEVRDTPSLTDSKEGVLENITIAAGDGTELMNFQWLHIIITSDGVAAIGGKHFNNLQPVEANPIGVALLNSEKETLFSFRKFMDPIDRACRRWIQMPPWTGSFDKSLYNDAAIMAVEVLGTNFRRC